MKSWAPVPAYTESSVANGGGRNTSAYTNFQPVSSRISLFASAFSSADRPSWREREREREREGEEHAWEKYVCVFGRMNACAYKDDLVYGVCVHEHASA